MALGDDGATLDAARNGKQYWCYNCATRNITSRTTKSLMTY